MTAPEYIQLKAFARIDGAKLACLWVVSFACYVGGLSRPSLTLVSLVLAVLTPFVSARMLRHFRDDALEGAISLGRGWGYVVFLFLYASLLFAAAQFVYFAYLDKGFFAGALSQLLTSPENAAALSQAGLASMMTEALGALATMRPIDLVLNILTTNLLIGCIVGLPVALAMKRDRVQKI